MLVIGLTGGIASGKSEAARHFQQLGAGVIDADKVSHDLVKPGSSALSRIIDAFGEKFLRADGSLDRAALGAHVFSNPAERKRLEGILHPLVREEMLRQLHSLETPYAILMAPLLLESGMTDLVDRLLVIDVPESLQRQRCQARDDHDAARIDQILAAQADRQSRLAAADDIICNDQDLTSLHNAIDVLHRQYLHMAANA